ncbi:hypothetical protein [Roseiconus lacunae]|uniref:hypothetical protein n=1 Tax=Roseiconus lacunae TaxID=2605694 RepID=UPI001E2CF862|nr:hypothetical protein [Roseiconus lacunae]MCD0459533.1 hypothetical protein [Roseiconus lacunae]
MFSLSEAAKYNLEAIVHEFQRASLWHGPLYHERLVPWGGTAPAHVTREEWDTFIELESEKLSDDEWWEWDGPCSGSPGWNTSFLGRWFGDPEGRDFFFCLVNSTLTVLGNEDVSEFPDLEAPFDFRSLNGWIGTLHAWAFRFQMPLLRSEMKVWGQDDQQPSTFFETVNLWRQMDGGKRYPAHPVRWVLVDDVFTSSIAALRALLNPDLVVTTNEPWPLFQSDVEHQDAESDEPDIDLEPTSLKAEATSDLAPQSADGNRSESDTFSDDVAASDLKDVVSRDQKQTVASAQLVEPADTEQRIILGPLGWMVVFSGDDLPVYPSQQAGLHRIAKLIETEGKSWEPEELATYGARRERRLGKQAFQRGSLDDTSHLSRQRKGVDVCRDAYGPEAVRERKRLKRERSKLEAALKEAEDENLEFEFDEVRKKLNSVREILNLSLQSDQLKKAKDNVATSIRNTIKQLKEMKPALMDELDLLLKQIDLSSPEITFVSRPNWQKWVVKVHM